MARITVTIDVEASNEVVWEELADLAAHTSWMSDAEAIDFVSPQSRGTGTTMTVATRIGPFRVNDVIIVTGWDEGHSIEVAHIGLVTGSGTLSVSPIGERTRIEWSEELTFPWWLGGSVTAWLSRPVLARVWRGNLARLAGRVNGL
jgi:hypothetical protein